MKFTRKNKRSSIDKEIENVLEVMGLLNADSVEYTKMANNLDTLMKARSYSKDQTTVSMDTVWTVGGSIIGILILIGYEQAHVITSKALGFVIKGRV